MSLLFLTSGMDQQDCDHNKCQPHKIDCICHCKQTSPLHPWIFPCLGYQQGVGQWDSRSYPDPSQESEGNPKRSLCGRVLLKEIGCSLRRSLEAQCNTQNWRCWDQNLQRLLLKNLFVLRFPWRCSQWTFETEKFLQKLGQTAVNCT